MKLTNKYATKLVVPLSGILITNSFARNKITEIYV